MRPTVGLVVPYFGTFPNYMPLTLRSMAHNPGVEWLLFTDAQLPGPAPPNVTVFPTGFDELRQRVQASFDFPINLPRPYKLCDFRPAFGEIFAPELSRFDLWGHSDLDVIFGDLEAALPTSVLQRERKVLIRGCLALYRNDDHANAWYRHEIADLSYRDVFARSDACHFDEWPGIARVLASLGIQPWHSDDAIFDLNFRRYRPRAHTCAIAEPVYVWRDGRMLELGPRSEREAGLLHLQKRPMRPPADSVLRASAYTILGGRFEALDDPAAVRRRSTADAVDAVRFHGTRLKRRARALKARL